MCKHTYICKYVWECTVGYLSAHTFKHQDVHIHTSMNLPWKDTSMNYKCMKTPHPCAHKYNAYNTHRSVSSPSTRTSKHHTHMHMRQHPELSELVASSSCWQHVSTNSREYARKRIELGASTCELECAYTRVMRQHIELETKQRVFFFMPYYYFLDTRRIYAAHILLNSWFFSECDVICRREL